MKKYIIERALPGIGGMTAAELCGAAAKSNDALAEIGKDVQWVESYVTANQTYCVYLAKDEASIQRHSDLSGFPATRVVEVKTMIDPTTATAAHVAPKA